MRTLAYLDPGSGSMILQMLLGGLAAIAVSIKMFGKKVFRTLAFWTFGMLRDAALLQLDLELEALEQGLTLKDATPFNVQFRGCEPCSSTSDRSSNSWRGAVVRLPAVLHAYLYPLLLQAYKESPSSPGSARSTASRRARQPASHRSRSLPQGGLPVALHARLERRYEAREDEVKEDLKKADFKTSYVKANVQRIQAGLRAELEGR